MTLQLFLSDIAVHLWQSTLFAFAAVLAVRGALQAVLGDRLFHRVSALVQTGLLVVVASALLLLPSLVLIAWRGITYGIEFTGGALVQLETARPVTTSSVRSKSGRVARRRALPVARLEQQNDAQRRSPVAGAVARSGAPNPA